MKALILDDNSLKSVAIARALRGCGITDVEYATDQRSGIERIKSSLESGQPFDLIVTDMHYPLEQGAVADTQAGLKLLERLEAEQIKIPVIVCSSLNFAIPEAFGTVWYNELRDIDEDFRKIVARLK